MIARRAMLAAMGGLPFARPDQHYEPPAGGAQIPGARGLIRAREVIIAGGSPPGSGLFVYKTSVAPGNLIAAITAAAGNDGHSNAVVQNIASYQESLTFNSAAQLAGALVNFYTAPFGSNGAGPYSLQSQIGTLSGVSNPPLELKSFGGVQVDSQFTLPGETWLPPSNDATGATDSANIAAALAAFTTVTLLPGLFYINQPIVLQSNGLHLHGSGGSIQSGVDASKDLGTTIRVAAGFTNPNSWAGQATAAIVMAQLNAGAGGGGANPPANQVFGQRISDLWIDGTVSPASVDGVAALGSVQSIGIERVGVYHATGRGFPMVTDTTWSGGAFPDGIYMDTCVAQTTTGAGFSGSYNDALLFNCHAQSSAADGFSFTNAVRMIGCRSDLNVNGYTFDAPDGGGGFYSTSLLIGCGTQGNTGSGLNLVNSSGSGTAPRAPVIAVGCDFDQDGTQSISASGRVMLTLSACTMRTGNSFNAGSPATSIALATSGSSSGAPVVLVDGCWLNPVTTIISGAASAGLLRVSSSYAATGLGAAVSTYAPYQVPAAPAASFTSHPAAPAGTVSTTLVMMGLGSSWAYTPASSGIVQVEVTGFAFNPATASSFSMGCRFGTGGAPANGAAVTGTRFGSAGDPGLAAPATVGKSVAFAFTDVLSLTAGTAYWFDIALATDTAADQIHLSNVSFTAVELAQ